MQENIFSNLLINHKITHGSHLFVCGYGDDEDDDKNMIVSLQILTLVSQTLANTEALVKI